MKRIFGMTMRILLKFYLSLACLLLLACNSVLAQTELPDFLRAKSSAPEIEASSWVLLESKTGWLLGSHQAHKRVDPASLTKMMTAYLTFDALSKDKISAEDRAYISKKAWKAPGSRMFLEVDNTASIGELIHGLIIQSGNDAAVVLAEHLGGSESGFAKLMNEQANVLGMNDTHYINASGLPAETHYTSAYDTAILSRALIQNFPDMYALFAIQEYAYNEITQANRNSLLWRDGNYDGLKTGYTKAAGYCLAGSAQRDNTRFIAVVMGAKSTKSRVQSVQALIEYGFAQYESISVLASNSSAQSLPLFKAEQDLVNISALIDVSILVPRGRSGDLRMVFKVPEFAVAPLSKQDALGQAELFFAENAVGSVALHPMQDHALGPFWKQWYDAARMKLF